MTNEQAIKWLKDYIQNTPFQMEQYERAFEMAIQALSQESEIEENIIKYMKKYPNHVGNTDFWEGFYACRNVVLQLDDEECSPKEQEPCDDIAQERYKDLCEYFGGAKDILKSREDFKAWLERVKWHIHKAEELYEKYEYKKEPCDDLISREAALIIAGTHTLTVDETVKAIKNLPPVTQKSGKWIEDAKTYYEELNKRGLGVDEYTPYFTDDIACSECLAKYNTIDNETEFFKYCPNCGAKMVEPQESENKDL